MKAERQSPGWLTPFQGCGKAKVFVLICAVTVVLSGSCLFVFGETLSKSDAAAEQGAASQAAAGSAPTSGVARYRVFSLKHISAEQGKKYLAEVGVGTVSQLPGRDVLLVTAPSEELVKASAILELVDAEEPFYIKEIFPASEVSKLPSNKEIAAKVGDISIGTFSSPPPSGTEKAKAIIDVHNGSVIAVASAGQIERIISAVEQLLQGSEPNKLAGAKPSGVSHPQADAAQSAKMVKASEAKPEIVAKAESAKAELKRAEEELKKITASSEPAGKTDMEVNEPNKLFDKLINSIAETGKTAADGQGQQLSQPNAVPTIPEANEPGKPSADLKQTEESASKAAEEPREPNLAAVESSEPNEAAEQPESEPNLKPASKVHSYEPAPITNGNEMLELDLPAKINIIDLVDLVGKYLQLDYMYDETQVKGEVSLKLQGPVKVKDLYPLLESVLKFRGFVMTRKGNLVTIVPAADALGIDPSLQSGVGGVQLGDVVITRVFRLRYIDTGSAQNLLTGMRLGASIVPIPETGTLIVTEYAYRMARVEELLDMVDQPGVPKQFRFRQLKYTMATTLASKVKTLAEQLGNVSVTVAAASPAQPTPRRTRGRPEPTPALGAPAAAPAAAAKSTVYLDADERTNRIMMIGLEEQLLVVDSLIDALDVEQQDLRALRLYDIQHVGADEVVKKLGELGIISGGKTTTTTGRITTGARTAGATAPATPAPATPAPAAAGEMEPLVGEPQVVVIESTNSLLVNATPEQHVQIATIISYVDSETLKRAIPYEIYALENQNPEDLAAVLQKFVEETVQDKEGKVQQTIKKTEENIIIVPDKNTFSILVYASKKNQEWIGSLIKQLDKRRPQVLIDVMLVAITEDDSFTYDLQLVSKLPQMAASGGLTALPLPLGFPSVSSASGPVKELTSTSGAFTGFYADSHIQALLKLMQTKGYGRILSRPKILVNDNEKGHIDTTKTLYVSRTTSQYLPSTIIGPNSSNTNVATSTTFDQYPSGIKLDITPHISEGSLLRLEVQVSQSIQPVPAGGIAADQPPPTKTEDNVNTVVTVPDSSTIILGGMIQLTQNKNTNKVPFLGDIPIAGGLFRSINNTSNQSKLYVFVKANILRPDETAGGLADLQKMSNRNRDAFERGEEKFEEHQDWPGIKPKPVEPLHLLESE